MTSPESKIADTPRIRALEKLAYGLLAQIRKRPPRLTAARRAEIRALRARIEAELNGR